MADLADFLNHNVKGDVFKEMFETLKPIFDYNYYSLKIINSKWGNLGFILKID